MSTLLVMLMSLGAEMCSCAAHGGCRIGFRHMQHLLSPVSNGCDSESQSRGAHVRHAVSLTPRAVEIHLLTSSHVGCCWPERRARSGSASAAVAEAVDRLLTDRRGQLPRALASMLARFCRRGRPDATSSAASPAALPAASAPPPSEDESNTGEAVSSACRWVSFAGGAEPADAVRMADVIHGLPEVHDSSEGGWADACSCPVEMNKVQMLCVLQLTPTWTQC